MGTLMNYTFDDGGRSLYFKGTTGDCVCRAIAIASGQDYKKVYDLLFKTMGASPRNGVMVTSPKYKRLMQRLGFTWIPTSGIGSHQAVHLIQGELPNGRLVCQMAKHSTAVINNEVRDIFDCRTNEFGQPKKVYGYWRLDPGQIYLNLL